MKKLGLWIFMVVIVLLISPASNANVFTIKHPGRIISFSNPEMQQDKGPQANPVYTCSMHPEVIQDKPGKCPKCGMNLIQKEVKKDLYSCPMHPEVTQDKPGKCPKCGMNLVKNESGKEEYTCPMHSDVIKDKAGKCPKCGMNLVLKQTAKK